VDSVKKYKVISLIRIEIESLKSIRRAFEEVESSEVKCHQTHSQGIAILNREIQSLYDTIRIINDLGE